jgi:hypothetical protein
MFDALKAFAIPNGLRINEEDGGPFITGGPPSPVGLDAPIGTIYFQTIANGFNLWEKFGPAVGNWQIKQFVAKELITEFFSSNSISTTTSTTFQNKINATTLPLGSGQYAIFWALEYTNENNNQSAEIQVLLSSQQIASDQSSFGSGSAGQYTIRSAVFLTDVISGVQTFQIQFRRVSGGTAAIRRATIGYLKVL